MKMKLVLIGAMLMALVGCTPSAETMQKVATLAGNATGMVINMTKMDDATKTNVCTVLKYVSDAVPLADQKCVELWSIEADKITAKMIEEGKIDAKKASLIKTVTVVAASGMDFVLNKYPKVKDDVTLVSITIHAYTEAVCDTLGIDPESLKNVEYDVNVYEHVLERARSIRMVQ